MLVSLAGFGFRDRQGCIKKVGVWHRAQVQHTPRARELCKLQRIADVKGDFVVCFGGVDLSCKGGREGTGAGYGVGLCGKGGKGPNLVGNVHGDR